MIDGATRLEKLPGGRRQHEYCTLGIVLAAWFVSHQWMFLISCWFQSRSISPVQSSCLLISACVSWWVGWLLYRYRSFAALAYQNIEDSDIQTNCLHSVSDEVPERHLKRRFGWYCTRENSSSTDVENINDAITDTFIEYGLRFCVYAQACSCCSDEHLYFRCCFVHPNNDVHMELKN